MNQASVNALKYRRSLEQAGDGPDTSMRAAEHERKVVISKQVEKSRIAALKRQNTGPVRQLVADGEKLAPVPLTPRLATIREKILARRTR